MHAVSDSNTISSVINADELRLSQIQMHKIQKNITKVPDAGDITASHEPFEEEKLFEESTHYFFIYGEDWNMSLLGLFVIIIQFILYGIIINQGIGDYSDDQVSVAITYNECYFRGGDLSPSNDTNITDYFGVYPNLVCEADDHSPGALYLAMILAAIFLQYDYLAALKILFIDDGCCNCKWSKFAAFCILCEAIMATFACSVFAVNGWYNGSVYDAIMNTIGVLFIHDIDEKVYESVGIIAPGHKRFAFCGKIGEFVSTSLDLANSTSWNIKRRVSGTFE